MKAMTESFSAPGRLSLIDLTEREREVFLKFLDNSDENLSYHFLSDLLPSTDFFRFLDIFSAEDMKIPSREEILKYIEYVQIFSFISQKVDSIEDVKGSDLSDAIVKQAASRFNKRVSFIRSSYDRVRRRLVPKGS